MKLGNFDLSNVGSTLSKYGAQFVGEVRKNSPTILSATAILCLIGSNVMVWKSKDVIEDDLAERIKEIERIEKAEISAELKKKERSNANLVCVKNVAVHALPFAVLSAASIAAIIGSLKINNRRVAMFSAAYAIAEKNLDDWKAKTEELVGKGKTEKIQNEVDKKHADEALSVNGEVLNTGNGTELFLDDFSGQLFMSDTTSVKAAVNSFNSLLVDEASNHLFNRICSDQYYEKDMCDLYDLLNLPIPKCAELRKWRNSELMDCHITVAEEYINGKNTAVKIVTFLNDVAGYSGWRDQLL